MGKVDAAGPAISVPQGGGALKGLGEKFSPDLHTGTGNFSVPITLPPGRDGFQPQLTLEYSTGAGNGPFGLGWNLSVPRIARLTSKGIPQFLEGLPAGSDTFLLSGAEDLVELGPAADTAPGDRRYRPRTEGLFAKIERHMAATSDYWTVQTKDGLSNTYGSADASFACTVSDPAAPRKIFAWCLTETRDLFGNRIVYAYRRDRTTGSTRSWDQLYLREVRYVDLAGADQAPFLVTIALSYDDEPPPPFVTPSVPTQARPDPFSDYRAGFEIRTRRRCKWIVVRTHPDAETTIPVRAYEIVYLDEVEPDPTRLPLNAVSLLRRIELVGFDDGGVAHRELPPVEFSYSRFSPGSQTFFPLTGDDLPATSLADADLELVDLFGNGLPDVLELGDVARYWRNLGNGRFDRPRVMAAAPAGLRLGNSGVQLLDANGDGRADLLVTEEAITGYFPLDFLAGWSPKSFRRYRQAPSFNLEDPEVRLLDLTGDGIPDALRSGTRFECYFNNAEFGWLPENARRIERKSLDEFPDVNFSDPRVKIADLCGDGLQDIAFVHEGRIDYWPNLGYGRWGARITLAIPGRLPFDFDPGRVILGDVDGDGSADLIYVSDREITFWINRCGNGFSQPLVIRGTPSLTNHDMVRLVDLLGSGVTGLLWSRDADGSGRAQHFFLDLTGGSKPYLLDRMDNNLGAVTEAHYAASTKFYLRDQASVKTRWRTTLPFPVQVIERVVATDVFSTGSLATEYRYHHGYWDGAEGEFRGFGMVEQIDTELFDAYRGRALDRDATILQRLLARQSWSPPLLTRTWFHQGPVERDSEGSWHEMDWTLEYSAADPNLLRHTEGVNEFLTTLPPDVRRAALRTLRGSILRSELYALDGSTLQERPYTVVEQAYGLREEEPPAVNEHRERIFCPLVVAQRTTQRERGDDPLTQLLYTSGYDAFGQPARRITVSCPRGWRRLSDAPSNGYLATLSHVQYAGNPPAGVYVRDRVTRARTFEVVDTAGRTVEQLESIDQNAARLRLIAESRNFYDRTPDSTTSYGAFVGLPFGQIGSFGALVRTEALIMTSDGVDSAYGGAAPPYLVPDRPFQPSTQYPAGFVAAAPELAGYLYRPASADNSEGYFAVTASRRYDFHDANGSGRGLILARRDPLGNETRIDYDAYGLLPAQIWNPMGLLTSATHNLRTLQPADITDHNGNTTRLRYSPAGLVSDTWVMGKRNAAANDPANSGDRVSPSVHVEYDFLAYLRSRAGSPGHLQPVYSRVVRRVFHDSDPDDTGETVEAREYTDGFGRLLQTRTQSDDVRFGDGQFGGGADFLSASQDDALPRSVIGTIRVDSASPNVTVSGWQRYDNKGRVIEKFEPFWSIGWDYARPTNAEFGEKITTFYDPRGQAVRTVAPDGSERRVMFGVPLALDDPPLAPADAAKFRPTPWEMYTYDANDNAGRTHFGDPDAASYRHHWNTPTSAEIDALGRILRTVVRHRDAPSSPTAPLAAIEEHVTRSTYDVRGNLLETGDTLGRLAFSYSYDLIGRAIRTESMDAGRRYVVYDAGGDLVEARDGKGALVLHAYDALHRPTRLWARDAAGEAVVLRERIIYGDEAAAPGTLLDKQSANLRGKPWQHRDEAGEVTTASYDCKGNALSTVRRFVSDGFLLSGIRAQTGPNWNLSAPRVDWEAGTPPELGSVSYETRFAFDAMSRIKWSDYPTCANGERYRLAPTFNPAGALRSVSLVGPLDSAGSGTITSYIERIAYNANGQRLLVAYGNGLLTRYAYDAKTFRLARLRTEHYAPGGAATFATSGPPMQDVAYGFDLSGNILRLAERVPGCGIRNTVPGVDASDRAFAYDPLYRLVSATGRECVALATVRPWTDYPPCGMNQWSRGVPNLTNAPDMTSAYRERYEYDPAGNMIALRHGAGSASNWVRYFGMSGFSPQSWLQKLTDWKQGNAVGWGAGGNRLTNVGDGDDTVNITHEFDASGNMVRENTERHFEWDHANHMKVFRNQIGPGRPSTYALYLYDTGGQRAKKLVVSGNGYRTTTYIGAAFEHHVEHETLASTDSSENCSLHLMDDKSRVAIVRVGPAFDDDGAPEYPVQYHLGDHLGSSAVVVSGDGQAINREEFFPYGETSFGGYGKKRYRFAGQERDEESGLSRHGLRYFASWLARWISADPWGPVASTNLFRALANNPLVRRDPNGTVDSGVTATLTDAGVIRPPARAPITAPSPDAGVVAPPSPDAGPPRAAPDAGVTAPSPDAGATRSPDAGSARPAGDAGSAVPSTDGGVTVEQLTAIFTTARPADLQNLARVLNAHARAFGLDIQDPVAVAHFLAQAGTETNLQPKRENLNYTSAARIASIWPSRFAPDSGVDAGTYVRAANALGDFVYDSRMGNDAGQGYFYRGGGLIQTTGRNNYVELQRAIDAGMLGAVGAVDVVANPDQINLADMPQLSALFYFQQRVLPLADAGFPSVKVVTQAVNGGQIGAAERQTTFNRALSVLTRPDAGP